MRRRWRLCKFCEDMHALDAWPHNCMPDRPARSDLPAPFIQTGASFDSVFNPVDGRRYSSRRQYEAEVHAHGCTVVGNESWATKPHDVHEPTEADVVGDVKRAIEELGSMSDTERANMMAAQETASADEMAAAGL
mgnify:CR=1 FL=1